VIAAPLRDNANQTCDFELSGAPRLAPGRPGARLLPGIAEMSKTVTP